MKAAIMKSFGAGAGGALTKQVVIAASSVLAKPESMGFEQGAALPTAFGTASQPQFDAGSKNIAFGQNARHETSALSNHADQNQPTTAHEPSAT